MCKSLADHSKVIEITQNETNYISTHEKELGCLSEVSHLEYVSSKIRDFLNIDTFNHIITKHFYFM